MKLMRARKVASSWWYSLNMKSSNPTIGNCTVALGGGGELFWVHCHRQNIIQQLIALVVGRNKISYHSCIGTWSSLKILFPTGLIWLRLACMAQVCWKEWHKLEGIGNRAWKKWNPCKRYMETNETHKFKKRCLSLLWLIRLS